MIQRVLALTATFCIGAILLIQFQNCAPYEAKEFEAQLNSQSDINIRQAVSYASQGKTDLRGGVLGLDKQGRLHIWAVDMYQPEKKLSISLKINGTYIGNIVADKSHPFLKELMGGPGDHTYSGRLYIAPTYRKAGTNYTAQLYVGGQLVTSQSYNSSWQLTSLKQSMGLSGDVYGSDDSESIDCSGSCKVRGKLGNDNIVGSHYNDHIWANGGNDVLYGHNGDDHLDGGNGDDLIVPGAGNDTIVFKQNATSLAEFDTVIEDESNSDEILCPTEKPTHCIDYYNQRILIFPSKSALTLEGSHRKSPDVTNCIRSCSYMSGLYPNKTIVYDGGSTDRNSAVGHIRGTSSSEIMLPLSGMDTLMEGGGGDDTYVLQNVRGHHVVIDKSGNNKIRCLNMRVVRENMEDGVRLSWEGGSLNIPHHSEARFRKSDGSLNADCQLINMSELGQGVM